MQSAWSQEAKQTAETKFKLLQEAYDVLSTDFKKALYDKGHDKQSIEEQARLSTGLEGC